MDDQRDAEALTDTALERDIARALAVDPSPEFPARVRTQIANEPRPTMWRTSWTLSAFALVAGAVVLAVVVNRPDVGVTHRAAPLAARAIAGDMSIPYVGSAFRRTYTARNFRSSLPSAGPAAAGPHVLVDRTQLSMPLLDPRETQALRALLAGVRHNRIDLSPLLTPTAQSPAATPTASDLVIAPIAIEPLAPQGAQGERE